MCWLCHALLWSLSTQSCQLSAGHRYHREVLQINMIEPAMRALTDEELRGKTGAPPTVCREVGRGCYGEVGRACCEGHDFEGCA